MINNPFLFTVAILQFLASAWYWIKGRPMFALLIFLYALANIVMVLMKGE